MGYRLRPCLSLTAIGCVAAVCILVTFTQQDTKYEEIRIRIRSQRPKAKYKQATYVKGEIQTKGERHSEEWIDDVAPGDVINPKLFNDDIEEFEYPALLSGQVIPVPIVDSPNTSLFSGMKLWSMDLKVGPIFALKHLFARFGIKVIDRSLSPLCNVLGTCAKVSEVPQSQWISLSERAVAVANRLLSTDSEFLQADAVICVYPVSLCEVYLPFGKPIIVVVDSRYELGRSEPFKWGALNKYFKSLFDNKRGIFVATSSYDQEYLRHYSGVSSVLLPFHVDYLMHRHNPTNPKYILMADRGQGFVQYFLNAFNEAAMNVSYSTGDTPELKIMSPGDGLVPSDATQYRGIIYIPHQVSFLALTEKYRMNIPLFIPKMELLVHWHQRYKVMSDRTLSESQSRDRSRSNIDGSSLPDPNDDIREWTMGFWVEFADFYEWPEIQHFRTMEQLYELLESLTDTHLFKISEGMGRYNEKVKAIIEEKWKHILKKVQQSKTSVQADEIF